MWICSNFVSTFHHFNAIYVFFTFFSCKLMYAWKKCEENTHFLKQKAYRPTASTPSENLMYPERIQPLFRNGYYSEACRMKTNLILPAVWRQPQICRMKTNPRNRSKTNLKSVVALLGDSPELCRINPGNTLNGFLEKNMLIRKHKVGTPRNTLKESQPDNRKKNARIHSRRKAQNLNFSSSPGRICGAYPLLPDEPSQPGREGKLMYKSHHYSDTVLSYSNGTYTCLSFTFL